MIRKIRNEFAHDLDIDSFSKLNPSLISGLKSLRVDIYKQFGEEEHKPKASLVEEYNAVAFFCIVGLDGYRENLSYLRSKIQKEEFIASLFKESMAENEAQLRAVMAERPINVEIRDGNRIETYSGGVVRIGGHRDASLDPTDVRSSSPPPPEDEVPSPQRLPRRSSAALLCRRFHLRQLPLILALAVRTLRHRSGLEPFLD